MKPKGNVKQFYSKNQRHKHEKKISYSESTVWKAIKINLMEIFSVCLRFSIVLQSLFFKIILIFMVVSFVFSFFTLCSLSLFCFAAHSFVGVLKHFRLVILHNSHFSLKLIFISLSAGKSFLSQRKRKAKISFPFCSRTHLAHSQFVYFGNKSKLQTLRAIHFYGTNGDVAHFSKTWLKEVWEEFNQNWH